MKKTLFIICLFFSVAQAQNQPEFGTFFINNFSPVEYDASTQNWAITQDDAGMMYFGNNSGVLQFDGSNWKLIPVTNNSCVRSVEKGKDGRIYVGATSELGYISADNKGVYKYFSLLSLVDSNLRVFYDIWEVFANDYGVYFISDKQIFLYKNNSIRCIHNSNFSLFASKIGNTIFIVEDGISIINDTALIPLPHSQLEFARGNPTILPFNDQKVLCINSKGFFLYNLSVINFNDPLSVSKIKKSDVIEPFNISFADFFKKNRIYCATRIDDRTYAIGTMPGGIVIFNKKGQLISNIAKQEGLRSNTVLRLFTDDHGNLWSALDNGISYLEMKNPITLFDEKSSLDGSVYTVTRFNNEIYCGTNVGLFKLMQGQPTDKNVNPLFAQIFGINFSNWDFLHLNNNLYVGTARGLLKIAGNKVDNVFKSTVIYCVEKFSQYPDVLFLGLSSGIIIYDMKNNIFHNLPEMQSEIRSICCDENKTIFLGTIYNGISRIDFPEARFDKPVIENLDTSCGLPTMNENYPYNINNELLVGTTKGIYKGYYSHGKHSVIFKPDTSFGIPMTRQSVDLICYDQDDYRYIINGLRHLFIVRRDELHPVVDSVTLRKVPSVNSLYLEPDNTLWMSTSGGLFKTELTGKSFDQPGRIRINKVQFGTDSVFFPNYQSYYQQYKPVVPFSHNSVKISFSLMSYEQIKSNQYSYRLEGFDNNWSPWTNQNFKEYTNLPEGNYTFHLKALDFYGNVSDEALVCFSILPPWYRTFYIYLSYLVIFGFIIWISIWLNSKRLKRANARLEAVIRQRTSEIKMQNENILKQNAEIIKQKEEILAQSKELERTNLELEKLSLVASETDNAVMILDASGCFEWVNDGFSRIYGYTYEQLIENKIIHLSDINRHPIVNESLKTCKDQLKPVRFETFLETEVRNVWIQTTLTPITDKNGKVIKIVAIDSDINQIKLAEEEISMQKEELLTQSEQLEEANVELEHKNLYITDSISYAKRIQMAMLPSMEIFSRHFKEFFIYFLPKDIVSGDFYWLSEQNDYIFIAVSDCTGHGVPGALMSMIGNTLLNNIVNERKIYTPSEILKNLNSEIIKSLNYETELGDNQEDGMDITLCRINKKSSEITIASANHHVFIIANNELKIIEGEYRSVGGIESGMDGLYFPDHSISYHGDIQVYMLTDGLVDQFGGPDNKKFMLSQFKRFVIENNTLPLSNQFEMLKSVFEKWKGFHKQIDDILVLAIKYSGKES